MFIIINADDLGKDIRINQAIFKLMSMDMISSSTIMANGNSVEDAVRFLKEHQNCSFGVHLNLTEFKPITASKHLEDVLDSQGNFAGYKSILRCNHKSPEFKQALFNEFCAQVDKLIKLDVNISHIDSHEHIHNIPFIFPLLKGIQKKYNIRKVRISKNIYSINSRVSNYLLAKKWVFNYVLKNYYKTKTTSGFTDLKGFIDNVETGRLRHKLIEIMVHPGNTEVNEDDINALIRFWSMPLPTKFRLINYNQL